MAIKGATMSSEWFQADTKLCQDVSHPFKRDKSTYVRTWGLKRGEGVYSKTAY